MSHPNIVTVFDHGEVDGVFYIVMEYVDGVNLRDLLGDGKMEPEQALAIVPPICEALEYAHGKGVVHRDIKPENLLLDCDGRVKIADFGIASLVGAPGEKSGTPAYMAPEQERGVVDRRADIYALGAVLYEMLTGERPAQDVVAPSKRVEVDVKIDAMVLRALEKEPERRYQTAGEFRTVVETMASAPGTPSEEQMASRGVGRVTGQETAKQRGMFKRFWWLFLGMLILGPLMGAVIGLRTMLPVTLSTVSAVIEVRGSEEASKITAERAMASETLDEVSRQLDLERAWDCKPHEVAHRLRRLIRVEPVIKASNLPNNARNIFDPGVRAACCRPWLGEACFTWGGADPQAPRRIRQAGSTYGMPVSHDHTYHEMKDPGSRGQAGNLLCLRALRPCRMLAIMRCTLSIFLAASLAANLAVMAAEAGPTRDFAPRQVLKKALPAITDAPVIEAAKVTDAIVQDNELVIGVVQNGEARAYPVNQLTGPRREIINDRLGGSRLAATW